MVQLRSRDVVRDALPPLCVSQHHTTSSALHPISFVGPLRKWQDFIRDVKSFGESQRWSRIVIDHELVSRDLNREKVWLGDEHGLQGRFQQSVGQTVGATLEAQSIDISFGDFKASGVAYDKVPDCALIATNPFVLPRLKAIGELKVPWVPDHDFWNYYDDDGGMRNLLAQPIQYMLELDVMFGWLSTYQQTIFLRQTYVNNAWGIEYSPIIEPTTRYTPTDGNAPPSAKQCYFFLSGLANAHGPVGNSTPRTQWIVPA
jgi:hypothetical protein